MLVPLLLIVLGLMLYLLSLKKRSKEVCNLPGPKGLPFIGNLHQIDGKKPHKTFTEWVKAYGPIYQIQFGMKPVIIASDYDSIYEILVTKGSDFAGRPASFRMHHQQQGTGFAFLDPSPKSHSLRKLTFKHLKTVGDGMLQIEHLAKLSNDSLLDKLLALKGEAVDPKNSFYHATMSMMFMLIFGQHFEEGDPEFKQLREIEDSQNLGLSPGGEGELLDLLPWLRHFNNKIFKLLQHAVKTRHEFWMKFLNRDQESVQRQQMKGVAENMMESIQQGPGADGIQLDDLDVEVAVFNLQVAGSVSTTLHLYCFFNIMLHYPHVMKKMQEEIDQVLGRQAVTLKDKDQLHYCRACVLELFRYATTGPLSIPHKAITDTYLRGHFVPKGTTVITNIWQLHHDPKLWDDPWEFIPERFLDNEGHVVLPDHPNRKHLLPFSAGPRVCVGEHLAHSRLFLWLTATLQKFSVEPETAGTLVSCDPRDFDVGLGIIPWPYKVKFVERTAA